MKNKKGFTLVELLAVIVILAILATAAFTLVIPRIEQARKDSFVNDARTFVDASMIYFLEHRSESTVSVATLLSEGYASTKGSSYTGTVTKDNEDYGISLFNNKYYVSGKISSITRDNVVQKESGANISDEAYTAIAQIKEIVAAYKACNFTFVGGLNTNWMTVTGDNKTKYVDPLLDKLSPATKENLSGLYMAIGGPDRSTTGTSSNATTYMAIQLKNGYNTCKSSGSGVCCVKIDDIDTSKISNNTQTPSKCMKTATEGRSNYNYVHFDYVW